MATELERLESEAMEHLKNAGEAAKPLSREAIFREMKAYHAKIREMTRIEILAECDRRYEKKGGN